MRQFLSLKQLKNTFAVITLITCNAFLLNAYFNFHKINIEQIELQHFELPKFVEYIIDDLNFVSSLHQISSEDVDYIKTELYVNIQNSRYVASPIYETKEKNITMVIYADHNNELHLALFKKSVDINLVKSSYQLINSYKILNLSSHQMTLSFGEVKFINEAQFLYKQLKLAQQENTEQLYQ